MVEVKVKVLEHGVGLELPKLATAGSAGADIRAAEDFSFGGMGQICAVKTGLSMEIPVGYELQIRPRSGLAAKFGITVLNSPGTIDSDYRGEIVVLLVCLKHLLEPKSFKRGERIAQIVLQPTVPTAYVEVTSLSDTERGEGGFGSTGV